MVRILTNVRYVPTGRSSQGSVGNRRAASIFGYHVDEQRDVIWALVFWVFFDGQRQFVGGG